MLNSKLVDIPLPIGSMYGIYANIGGILMVNVTIYSIHGSYGLERMCDMCTLIRPRDVQLISVGLSSAWFPGRSQHILTIFAICFFNAGTPWNPGNSMGVFGLIHPFLHQTWPWFVGLMRYTWLSTSRSPKKNACPRTMVFRSSWDHRVSFKESSWATMGHWKQQGLYPLVNIQRTMENHFFYNG